MGHQPPLPAPSRPAALPRSAHVSSSSNAGPQLHADAHGHQRESGAARITWTDAWFLSFISPGGGRASVLRFYVSKNTLGTFTSKPAAGRQKCDQCEDNVRHRLNTSMQNRTQLIHSDKETKQDAGSSQTEMETTGRGLNGVTTITQSSARGGDRGQEEILEESVSQRRDGAGKDTSYN